MSSEQSSVNAETIEQTKQQIRSLVNEISQLSKSDLEAEQYYAAFLQRVVAALAATGGAIWVFGEGRRLTLAYQINLSESLLDSSSEDCQRHHRLVEALARNAEGMLVPPLSGATDERAGGNPTRYLLVVCPLRGDSQNEGLVEIFQRPDSPPATQRGYLRFLQQMCELASEWVKTQKLRQFSDRHSLWAQADQFSRLVHESLDLRSTAYAVANEGRRLIGCDRVSVGIMHGRKCVIESISGQDSLEHRSNIVAALGRLASKVVATGEPLRYEGSTEDLPPQIEKAIHDYVDESYAKSIVVLPMRRPAGTEADVRRSSSVEVERETDHLGEVIGALIVEQLETHLPRNVFEPRLDMVYEHSARALANSLDHSTLFLMPVWRTLGRASWVVKGRALPKTLLITTLVIAAILVLTFVKKDFYLKAEGSVQPVVKRDVFVDVGGTVTDVYVEDQKHVKKGEPLLQLENTDVEVQLVDVDGKLQAAREQMLAARDALARQDDLKEDERIRLFGQVAELTKQIESLQEQRALLDRKKEKLRILSPITGQVMISWDVARSLKNRTVEPGQILMAVADTSQDWELELFMLERRMGHVDQARQQAPGGLPVKYVLATDPKTTRIGKVKAIEEIAQVHAEEGNTVRVRVDIQKDPGVNLRPGATVTAKLQCGRRSIGYTWFHEAVEWLQAHVLF
jgi:multidrug efflux pump subunit AcrA (membrane-fusion protein)